MAMREREYDLGQSERQQHRRADANDAPSRLTNVRCRQKPLLDQSTPVGPSCPKNGEIILQSRGNLGRFARLKYRPFDFWRSLIDPIVRAGLEPWRIRLEQLPTYQREDNHLDESLLFPSEVGNLIRIANGHPLCRSRLARSHDDPYDPQRRASDQGVSDEKGRPGNV